MSAGLPGVGLSGVFFIVSALIMLPLEIARTVRGKSSLKRWSAVLRHLAMAIAMVVALELAYAGVWLAVEHLGVSAHKAHTLPLLPVLATLGLVGCLVLAAKAAQLLARRRARSGHRASDASELTWRPADLGRSVAADPVGEHVSQAVPGSSRRQEVVIAGQLD